MLTSTMQYLLRFSYISLTKKKKKSSKKNCQKIYKYGQKLQKKTVVTIKNCPKKLLLQSKVAKKIVVNGNFMVPVNTTL